MIERLPTHLERAQIDIAELRSDTRDVRERLIRLEERVSHLPDKGFIVTAVLIGLSVVGGLIAFQDWIKIAAKASGAD